MTNEKVFHHGLKVTLQASQSFSKFFGLVLQPSSFIIPQTIIFPPPNLTVFWVNRGSRQAPEGRRQYWQRLGWSSTDDSSEKYFFLLSNLQSGCWPWLMQHGFLAVSCLALVSGQQYDRGDHCEQEFDVQFLTKQALRAITPPGAPPGPASCHLKQLSCAVCPTWVCHGRRLSLGSTCESCQPAIYTHWRCLQLQQGFKNYILLSIECPLFNYNLSGGIIIFVRFATACFYKSTKYSILHNP